MLISEYRKTKVHRHLWVVVVGGFILLGTLVADLLHFLLRIISDKYI